jgi:hypothetical protein
MTYEKATGHLDLQRRPWYGGYGWGNATIMRNYPPGFDGE